MPGAVRKGDKDSGHGLFPPRANDEGSPNVFINGIASHRVGDHWVEHKNPDDESHDATAGSGSPTVFVNGKPKARIGDSVSCGSKMAEGSLNVFVNS